MPVTLDQAQQASAEVDILNADMNALTTQLANVQAEQAKLAAFDLAAAQAKVADKLAAVNAEIAVIQTRLTNQTAIVGAYNTANPTTPINVG